MITQAITDLTPDRFASLMTELGLKPFAASQILSWLYQKRVGSFEEMTNLPRRAREALQERFILDPIELDTVQEATDGTKKFLCRLHDGAKIECVLIPTEKRLTACISSQVGCAIGCDFCRTAKMGFKRNLSVGEITGQLRIVMRATEQPLTNVVLMGMGEPLANLQTVSEAVGLMISPKAFGLSKRHVTLSTSGLLPQLEKFVKLHDIKIAISLSATTDELRDKLMPINRRYPIAEIMKFCRAYTKDARHRVTFEYVLLEGVNDTREDAKRLVKLLTGIKAKVNLLPWNPFAEVPYHPSPSEVVTWWSDYLREHGVQSNIRVSRGQDILAACGQLAIADQMKQKGTRS